MNVNQAKTYLAGREYALEQDMQMDKSTRLHWVASEAFLECHELYKPLVEALEKMNRGHWGEAPELTNQALLYFRTKILGEL